MSSAWGLPIVGCLLLMMVSNGICIRRSPSFVVSDSKRDMLDIKLTKGWPARPEEYGFVTRIIYKLATFCAGSLLTEEWVLTAAFCVPNPDYPGDIEIEVDRINLESPGGEVIQGKSVHVHPKYIENEFGMYDLALLQLCHPIQSKNFPFLQLSAEPWPTKIVDKYRKKCSVAGFGAIGTGRTTSKTLTVAALTMRHGRHGCRCYSEEENTRVICSNEKKIGLCDEDNGAPLVCDNLGYGVAHQSYEVENCNPLRTKPLQNKCRSKISSFIFICPELTWIRSIVKNSNIPLPPASCKGSRTVFMVVVLVYALIIKTFS